MTNHQELRAKQAPGPRIFPKNNGEKSVKLKKNYTPISPLN